MGKAPKGAKRKKALAVKDLTVKDAKTVKGGTLTCATGKHITSGIITVR